ncbi:MAG: hypothetical protein K9L59_00715 [Desulfobacterales bacterium]|nr:hypothetical protein [Desulfobacterales bacterium]
MGAVENRCGNPGKTQFSLQTVDFLILVVDQYPFKLLAESQIVFSRTFKKSLCMLLLSSYRVRLIFLCRYLGFLSGRNNHLICFNNGGQLLLNTFLQITGAEFTGKRFFNVE